MSTPEASRLREGQSTAGAMRVGVCGFCLPQAQLFARFRLLEVQQTFYQPPQLKTVERWRRAAPEDFEFTIKAFQAITHPWNGKTYRRTRLTADELAQCGNFCDSPVVRDGWRVTKSLAEALRATCVLLQSPPAFDAKEEHLSQLRSFLHWAERGGFLLAWEPRHASWTAELVADLCRELSLIHAVDPLEQPAVTGAPKYFRLHGHPLGAGRYDYNRAYSDADLDEIRRRCGADRGWCLFNNIPMAADAERFARSLVRTPCDD